MTLGYFLIWKSLEKILNEQDITQQQAAALACSQSPFPEVQVLFESRSDLQSLIQSGHLTGNITKQTHLLKTKAIDATDVFELFLRHLMLSN
ncbi:MAG: hypothetical protein QNJ51_29785 [Calothrix sp. MO_167.B12]|nr:hypothetical protein [Calothrix sp. MO_167.B12]